MSSAVAIGLGVVAGGATLYLLAELLLADELAVLRPLARLGGDLGGGGSGGAIKIGAVVAGGLLTAALVARMV